jgi:glutaredoxin
MPVSPDDKARPALTFMLSLLMHTGAAAGDIHRWTDSEGNMHFGDQPPVAVDSEIVKLRVNTYSSPGIEALAEIFQTDDRVVMYSASWCGVCKKAKRYFQDKGIGFTEHDIETSAQGRRDYNKLGARGVPVILVGRRRLNGFSAASFEGIYHR